MTVEHRYRCCPHCADDPIHGVDPDGHSIPCNAPKSKGCVGRDASPDHAGATR